jgi:hypothetical protein
MKTPITFRPIEAWPRVFSSARGRSRFDSTYAQTLELLDRELTSINARSVVIQLALSDSDIRRDGYPRAQARPSHPGVILSFELRPYGKPVEPYSMPCDTFSKWEENLRAIALTLEALRKIARYGVTQSHEQYRGWAALPPASGDSEEFSTREDAAAFIARGANTSAVASDLLRDADNAKVVYRIAMRKMHPDAGGDAREFRRLQNAYAKLTGEK